MPAQRSVSAMVVAVTDSAAGMIPSSLEQVVCGKRQELGELTATAQFFEDVAGGLDRPRRGPGGDEFRVNACHFLIDGTPHDIACHARAVVEQGPVVQPLPQLRA